MDEKIKDLTKDADVKIQLLNECLEVIKNSPTNHAYTTYEESIVKHTITRVVEHVKNYFKL